MDAVTTWICLGGGIVMVALGVFLAIRLQEQTRHSEEEDGFVEHPPGD